MHSRGSQNRGACLLSFAQAIDSRLTLPMHARPFVARDPPTTDSATARVPQLYAG